MVDAVAIAKYGCFVLRKPPKLKINPKQLGYIRPDGIVNFQTAEAAENYAKNRCVAALQGKKPFERGIIVKDNMVLAEVNGSATKADMSQYTHKMSGASFFHGHPNISLNGALPLSLDDYLVMISQNLNKIVAFNKNGEYSAITQKPSKSIILRLLPKKWQKNLNLVACIGNGSIATEQYAKEFSKLFPKEIRDKVRQGIHKEVGTPYASYSELAAFEKNKFTESEQITARNIGRNLIKDGTLAKAINDFWINLAKKLDFNYETNFSNLVQ